MGDTPDDPMTACDDLAEPMGDLVGGGVGVAIAGKGGVAGLAAGYAAYEAVSDIVQDNWHGAVCEPLSDAATTPSSVFDVPTYLPPPPESPAITPDFASYDGGAASSFSGGGSDS